MRDFSKLDSNPERDYNMGVAAAADKEALIKAIEPFEVIAADALKSARAMTDFGEFKRGLELERKGKFAGTEWAEKYADIVMPEVMFTVSLYAAKFMAPWSVTLKRLMDVGRIVRSTGNNLRHVRPE
jgi:hypothetical protein